MLFTNPHADEFIQQFHWYIFLASMGSFLLAILWYSFYHLRVSMIKSFKGKYDFINAKEISNYKIVWILVGIGVGFAVNLYQWDEMLRLEVWFFVRIFMGIAGGTLVSYVVALILDFYYPTLLHRKLVKWRYMPRINPANGRKMKLLSEDEEDVHLAEGQQAEEHAFSIDYDVWIDEKTGDIVIDKYPGHLEVDRCNNCGYYTMRVKREEVTKAPGGEEHGELVKYYQCSYCKVQRATIFPISTYEAEDYKKMKPTFRKNVNIDLVRIEIHSPLSGKQFFEFPTLEQAKRFMEEFDIDKVASQ
jgi:hypothetical protein